MGTLLAASARPRNDPHNSLPSHPRISEIDAASPDDPPDRETTVIPCFATLPARLIVNPRRDPGPYGEPLQTILSLAGAAAAGREIAAWPGYAATPLVGLPPLADTLGVASIDYKDKSGRFGLGSFKALGGAYAVYRLLADRVEAETGQRPSAADLAAGRHAVRTRGVTVVCATDGNHGRSVAWGARMFGCGCVIYIHATVSPARAEAIAAYGARVIRTAGTYDDAVRQAAQDAVADGSIVVSDTSYPGYMDIPRDVMQGYTVLVEETLRQLAARREAPPTHVFVQGGVGGLAAAVTAHLWDTLGPDRPFVVLVEPETAACLCASAEAGRAVAVDGDLDTIMAGLACGEPSLLAWQILDPGVGAFMTVADEAAEEAMRLLARGEAGARLVSGELGAAGLAGLLCLAARDDWRRAIGLDGRSRVLLIGSEGDTDPVAYRRIVDGAAAARPVHQ